MAIPVEPVAKDAATEPEKDGLPVLPPLAAVGELAAAFAIIYGIDWLRPELAVLDMQPHPFWIPLLLLSLQYGTVSGLVAAGVAIAATMVAGLPEPGIGENHFAYFLRVWGQPILWIAMALLVGQFRMRQIATKQELWRANDALARQRADLAAHCTSLRERCEVLDRELATRRGAEPFQALAALADVEQRMADGAALSPRELLARLAPAAFGDARLTVLVAGTNRMLHGVASFPEGSSIKLSLDHPLARAVLERGETVGALHRNAERMLAGVALAAVPVRDDTGKARGMLLLDGGCAKALSDDGLAALSLIASRLGPVLDGESVQLQPAASAAAPSPRRRVPWKRGAVRDGRVLTGTGASAGSRRTAET